MIDVHSEDLIGLTEAAKLVPGGPVHRSTIDRWRLKGVNGVKLETIQIGGKRYTSRQAIFERFIPRTNATASKSPPATNDKGVASAELEMGIGPPTSSQPAEQAVTKRVTRL